MNRNKLISDVFDSYRYLRHAFMPPKSIGTGPNAPTRAQLGILFTVAQCKSVSIKDLAEQFGMTSSAATQLVDSLEEHKLIVREEDKDDRRRIRLALTAKAKKLLQATRRQRMKSLTKVLEPLTDAELKQLASLQQKLSHAHS